jgi:integrase
MGEWEGGYWRKNKAGRTVYYIRKRIDGRLYEVSTRATGRRAALDHLARFESDPSGYTPHGALGRDRLVLTVELAKAFTDWSEAPRSKGGKQNTRLWVNHQVRVLAWWRGVIGDRDLRRVDVAADIEEPAAKEGGTAEKIRVIKSLYGWLRKKKRILSPADDPTLDTLVTPQATSGAGKRDRAISRKQFMAIRKNLGAAERDRLDIQGGTGWHTSELMRFARDGSIEGVPPNAPKGTGAAGVLVCPLHKGGDPIRTAVSKDVLAAARRVLDLGPFSQARYEKAVRAAARKAKVKGFGAGAVRHSVATWGVDAGAPLSEMSAFLGHKSPLTTRRFYARFATAKKVPTLR